MNGLRDGILPSWFRVVWQELTYLWSVVERGHCYWKIAYHAYARGFVGVEAEATRGLSMTPKRLLRQTEYIKESPDPSM